MSEIQRLTASKPLLALLADGEFHSGTQLAQSLGLSRSGIWKQLQNLQALGLEVSAVSGKGYKLNPALQLLDADAIRQQLESSVQSLLSDIHIFDQINSTNSYLLTQAQQAAGSGLVCLAEYQSAGRGRRGRQWVSPFGHNIYLSILWRYAASPSILSGLSLAVGVACAKALQQFGVEDIALKWPNDLYWQQRKLAGILVEVSGESAGPCHAVIGLGLNLYLPSDQAQQIDQAWIDLQHILGLDCLKQRNRLVAELLNQLLPVLAEYENSGLTPFIEQWRAFDCVYNQRVQLEFGQHTVHGRAVGIDAQGLIQIEDDSGQIRSYASGEVSLRRL